jgi:hypothetical protein
MRPASWWSATMKWQDIRDRFPHRWLVLEAPKSRREEGKHHEFPQRESFFYHLDQLEVRASALSDRQRGDA